MTTLASSISDVSSLLTTLESSFTIVISLLYRPLECVILQNVIELSVIQMNVVAGNKLGHVLILAPTKTHSNIDNQSLNLDPPWLYSINFIQTKRTKLVCLRVLFIYARDESNALAYYVLMV
jgi:hypothetical protein